MSLTLHSPMKYFLLLKVLWLKAVLFSVAIAPYLSIAPGFANPIPASSPTFDSSKRTATQNQADSSVFKEKQANPTHASTAEAITAQPAEILHIRDMETAYTEAEWLAQSSPEDVNNGEESESSEEVNQDTEATIEADDDGIFRITVTGTRTPRTLETSPANVTVIDFEEIDRILANDIRDLVRYEPGITVRSDARYGLQDFTIRGLDGNRVLLQVDGIRIPTRFEFGPFQLGRDYVDIETLSAVEIIRGPASALYGSDALAGVVSYFTLDPGELLDLLDQDIFRSVAINFDSVNNGFSNTGLFASRLGNLELLLGYTRRDRSEGSVAGDDTFLDQQEGDRNNILGTLVYRFDDYSLLNFTTEIFDDSTDIEIAESNLGPTDDFENVDLNTNRERLSLAYEYDNEDSASFLQFGRLQFYFQNSREEELREREFIYGPASGGQFSIGSPTRREDDYDFLDRVWGANLQFRSDFDLGNVGNRLTYGVEVSTTRNERPRSPHLRIGIWQRISL